MARVHPWCIDASSSTASVSSTRETFTVWMKSLVLHGNGLTVFNSNGEIVYRIDNYDTKLSDKVFLMDLHGKVICSLLKKRRLMVQWDGYKCEEDGEEGARRRGEKPWFRVRKTGHSFLRGRLLASEVRLKKDELGQEVCYEMKGSMQKSFKIVDESAKLIAEVRTKQSKSRVALGNDVLSLVVEPYVDQSFVVALVAAFSLLARRM